MDLNIAKYVPPMLMGKSVTAIIGLLAGIAALAIAHFAQQLIEYRQSHFVETGFPQVSRCLNSSDFNEIVGDFSAAGTQKTVSSFCIC